MTAAVMQYPGYISTGLITLLGHLGASSGKRAGKNRECTRMSGFNSRPLVSIRGW
jgi:hypothetical protein